MRRSTTEICFLRLHDTCLFVDVQQRFSVSDCPGAKYVLERPLTDMLKHGDAPVQLQLSGLGLLNIGTTSCFSLAGFGLC